jgi:SAM-dependent methyltransferase
MCSTTCLLFCFSNLTPADVAEKRIIEIGACDHLTGTVRAVYETWSPREYVGTDLAPGPGVDEVVDVSALLERFGPESFDVVVTTETFEHIRHWRTAVHNIKGILRPGGILIVTTRSRGFPFHYFPGDYWRYEISDFRQMFADLSIENLLSDPQEPGVFLRARKPANFTERDLSDHRLYNILAGIPTREIEARHLKSPRYAWLVAQLTFKIFVRRFRNAFRAKNYVKPSFEGYRPSGP